VTASSEDDGPVVHAGSGDRRNVVLTGFMGTGKTTVGRLLAAEIGFEFVDTDAVIESRHGAVPTIFAEQGEVAFRSIEREVAVELAERDGLVIATGGGLMVDPGTAAVLESGGRVLCLVASAESVLERVLADASGAERPLLADPDPSRRIIELLAARADAYARFTPVHTDGRAPADIASEIARRLGDDASGPGRRS